MPAQAAPLASIDIGDIRVTYLPDGVAHLEPTAVFPDSNTALWEAHREYLDTAGQLVAGLGAFLIQAGEHNVVVDLGFGDMEVALPGVGTLRGGQLMESLKQVGVEASEIDTVVYTHLHLDHVGWTAPAGSLTFERARHLAGAGEWDFWKAVTDPNLAGFGPNPEAVQAPLESRVDSVVDGGSIVPGVTALATPGHTPGHIAVVISSAAERAIILGDSILCPLQFDEQDLGLLMDVDQALAKRTRERIAAELDDPATIAANGHFSGTVFGRLMRGAGKTYTPVPGTSR